MNYSLCEGVAFPHLSKKLGNSFLRREVIVGNGSKGWGVGVGSNSELKYSSS